MRVIYLHVWTVTIFCQLQKDQTNVHISWILCSDHLTFRGWCMFLACKRDAPKFYRKYILTWKMHVDNFWIKLTDFSKWFWKNHRHPLNVKWSSSKPHYKQIFADFRLAKTWCKAKESYNGKSKLYISSGLHKCKYMNEC
jgi:hypothetical protein